MIQYIPADGIEASAINFLKKYHPSWKLPIPIEEIIEFQLGIDIVPVRDLFSQHNVDAFLSQNQKEIFIDQSMLESRITRTRFSLAHELGHIVLHSEYLKSTQIDSIEKWKVEVLGKGSGHAKLEIQANMFAGFLVAAISANFFPLTLRQSTQTVVQDGPNSSLIYLEILS